MPSTQIPQVHPLPGQNTTVPVRKLVPAVYAMEFWNKILDQSMAKFKADNAKVPPKLVARSEYAIRGLTSWVDIHKRFQDAMEVYDGNKSKTSRITKRMYRSAADNSDVLRIITDIVPDGTLVTPVKTAIQGIVDIVQTAANVRELVRNSFEEDALQKSFAKVEIYLATFPEDENIERTSVSLIACILKAVELAIAFLLSATVSRVLHSLKPTSEYMQELAYSITEIPQKTQDVIETANDSNIVGTRKAMSLGLKAIEDLLLLETDTRNSTKMIATQADLIVQQGDQLILGLDSLKVELRSQFREQTESIKQTMNSERVALGNDIKILMEDLEKKRDLKEAERLAEDIEKHARDTERHEEQLRYMRSIDERLRALEDSRPTTPVPRQHYPPAWSLPPPTYAPYSPQWLSAYDQTSWQSMGVTDLYKYSQAGPSGSQYTRSHVRHPIPPTEPTFSMKELLEALNMSSIDKKDIGTILECSESVHLEYRLRARAIVRTDKFQRWASRPNSSELLIQRDRLQDRGQSCNAVSLVAASLMETLRSRDRYVSLVFFCRRHTNTDDSCVYSGPTAMIRSFVAQLLEQSYQGYSFPRSEVDLEGVRAGNVAVLCTLLKWLVKYLPEKEKKKTLVCIADGIDAYENGEEEDDLRTVIDSLLGLARSKDLDRVVKVLATSPLGTVSIDEAFQNDPLNFLSMEGLQISSYEGGNLQFKDEAMEV